MEEHLLAEYVEELPVHHDTTPVTIQGFNPNKPIPKHIESHPMRFGGIDLAKRSDHSAIIILKYDNGILKQEGHYEWPHVNYAVVAKDTAIIHSKMPMELIGFDRSGVGDAASELFDKSMLPLTPIVSTMNRKIDMIRIVRALFNKGILKVDQNTKLPEQIQEQEEYISKAGNSLYNHPTGRHDDMFWALAFACFVAVPFILNQTPPSIKQGYDDMYHFKERDIDAEIEQLMGNVDSISYFG